MSLKKLGDYLCHLYFQYELMTALYMLEPWEKRLFNSILIAIIAMSVYTTYIFLPHSRLLLL